MLLNHFSVSFLVKSIHVTGVIAITGDKPLTWLFMSLNLISSVFKKQKKKKKSLFSLKTKGEKAGCSFVFLGVDKVLWL